MWRPCGPCLCVSRVDLDVFTACNADCIALQHVIATCPLHDEEGDGSFYHYQTLFLFQLSSVRRKGERRWGVS